MRPFIVAGVLLAGLLMASHVYAIPQSSELGYEGEAKDASAWGKYLIVVFAAGGVFAWWKKKK